MVIDGNRYDNLYQFVASFARECKASFHCKKPKKTFTPAYDVDGQYYFGRSQEILATKKGVLERFSVLQSRFLAAPASIKTRIQEAVWRKLQSHESLCNDLKENLGIDLHSDAPNIHMLLSFGIKAGTDAYKSMTGIEIYDQLARLLESVFAQEKVGANVPYSKQLAKIMAKRKLDIVQLKNRLRHNPTLAAMCMEISLDMLHEKQLLELYKDPINQDNL